MTAATIRRFGADRRLHAAAVLAALGLLALCVAPAAGTARHTDDTCASAPPAGFQDVEDGNVHRRAIDCIKHLGITTGKTADTYDPSGTLPRDQLASFLARTVAAGGEELPPATEDHFDDDDGSTHEDAINRLAEAGILTAEGRTLRPSESVTRAEMSRVTASALTWAGTVPATGTPPDFFLDDRGSADEDAINRLTDAGVVTGKGSARFAPGERLTRAQMATFLARAADAIQDGPGAHHHCRIHTPERPRFDAWYSQQCEVFGIPVVGSERVAPEALMATVDVFIGMLGQRPELHAELASSGFYFILLGEEEGQTDPPEYRHLKDDPNEDWDERARGLGGTDFASAGEENVLCRDSDRYFGESILVHEFSHTVMEGPLAATRPELLDRLQDAYDRAMAAGRWRDTYAAEDVYEYWAEGVQSYLDANGSAAPPDGVHGSVDTREELEAYDPALHDIVEEAIGAWWRYACP